MSVTRTKEIVLASDLVLVGGALAGTSITAVINLRETNREPTLMVLTGSTIGGLLTCATRVSTRTRRES